MVDRGSDVRCVQGTVRRTLVRVQGRTGLHVGLYGRLHRHPVHIPHRLRLDPAAPLPHADHRGLANGTTASVQLLRGVLILLLATDVGFIDFNDTGQHRSVAATSLTEPLEDEPSRLLRDPNLLSELQAGHALAGRHEDVDRVDPFMQRNMGPLEYGPGADGEVLVAVIAAVESILPSCDVRSRPADRASHAVLPPPTFQVQPGSFLVREHLEKLERADS